MIFVHPLPTPKAHETCWPWHQTRPRPYRCPVCNGRGLMPTSFYTNLPVLTEEHCRSCGGTGIVTR
jgi:hypothetical protein